MSRIQSFAEFLGKTVNDLTEKVTSWITKAASTLSNPIADDQKVIAELERETQKTLHGLEEGAADETRKQIEGYRKELRLDPLLENIVIDDVKTAKGRLERLLAEARRIVNATSAFERAALVAVCSLVAAFGYYASNPDIYTHPFVGRVARYAAYGDSRVIYQVRMNDQLLLRLAHGERLGSLRVKVPERIAQLPVEIITPQVQMKLALREVVPVLDRIEQQTFVNRVDSTYGSYSGSGGLQFGRFEAGSSFGSFRWQR